MADLFSDEQPSPAAKTARDDALQRIKERGGNWRDRALAALPALSGFEGTAEDIRIKLMMKGLDRPHHHNVWGEFTKEAVRRRLVLPTGTTRHMRGSKSHSRMTPVYRVK